MNKVKLSDYDIYEMMLKDCSCGASGTLTSVVAGPVSKDNMVMVYCFNAKYCGRGTNLYSTFKEAVTKWNDGRGY